MARPKKAPDPPVTAENVSYRGFRTADGKWHIHKGTCTLRYQGDNPGVSTDVGPWQWGTRSAWSELTAWSLLMDVLQDQERVGDVVQTFLTDFVCKFHRSGWMMSQENILAAVERIERERKDGPRRTTQ